MRKPKQVFHYISSSVFWTFNLILLFFTIGTLIPISASILSGVLGSGPAAGMVAGAIALFILPFFNIICVILLYIRSYVVLSRLQILLRFNTYIHYSFIALFYFIIATCILSGLTITHGDSIEVKMYSALTNFVMILYIILFIAIFLDYLYRRNDSLVSKLNTPARSNDFIVYGIIIYSYFLIAALLYIEIINRGGPLPWVLLLI